MEGGIPFDTEDWELASRQWREAGTWIKIPDIINLPADSGREQQASAKCQTNLLLCVSVWIIVTQLSKRVGKKKKRGGSGVHLIYSTPHTLICFQLKKGKNVLGRCKHLQLLALGPSNRLLNSTSLSFKPKKQTRPVFFFLLFCFEPLF